MKRFAVVLALLAASTTGTALADTRAETKGDCSAAFAQVDVKGDLTINNQCGFSRKAVEEIRQKLLHIRKDQKLSLAQSRSLAEAMNIMLGMVLESIGGMKTTLDTILAVTTGLSEKFKTDPRADLPREAREWRERYEKLLEQWKLVEGSTARDEEVRKAFERLDLDKAGRLLDELLAEQDKLEAAFAARHYQRAQPSFSTHGKSYCGNSRLRGVRSASGTTCA